MVYMLSETDVYLLVLYAVAVSVILRKVTEQMILTK